MKAYPALRSTHRTACEQARRSLAKWMFVCLLAFGFTAPLSAATYYWTPSSAATGEWANNAGTPDWSLTSGDSNPSLLWPNATTNAATIERSVSLQIGADSAGGTVTVTNLTVEPGSLLTLNSPEIINTSATRNLLLTGSSSGNVLVEASNAALANTGTYNQLNLQGTFNGEIEAKGNTKNRIQLTATGAGGVNAKINLTGGELVLTAGISGGTVTIGELKGTAGSTVSPNSGSGGIRTLEVNQTTNTTFAGTLLADSGVSGRNLALTKSGTGELTLTGANAYTGSTLVSGGTLLISGTGTINATSGVTVSTGGTLRYDSSVGLNRNVTLNGGRFANNSVSNYTGTLTFNSGTLGGSNLSGQTFSIGTNQILAPGNSTGTLSAGATTWANGGTLQFEINDATGTAGSTTAGWDLFTPTTLDITAGVGQFTVQILSLDSLQASGLAQNFIDSNNYQWLLVDAGSAITGFNADRFVLNASGFQNAYSGSFSISQGTGLDTDKLYLNYAAVPEPSTTLLLTGALTALVIFRRRRRQS